MTSSVDAPAGPRISRGDVALRLAQLTRRAHSERRWTNVTLGVGAAIVVGVPLLALVAPLFLPPANQQHLSNVLAAPSLSHPFGTDSVGRDLLARVLGATWLDYQVGLVTTYAAMTIGLVVGALAGYVGGLLDALVMRLVDVLLAFPFMIFVIALVAVVGRGLSGVYIGLISFGWASFARISRAEMLALRERPFMQAARTLGLPRRRIVFVHALPNLVRPNLVFSMATMVINILTLAALSYLGLGVQPPRAEWGAIIADGQQYLFTNWWISTLPGVVLVLVGVGFSLLGDGLADRLGDDFRIIA